MPSPVVFDHPLIRHLVTRLRDTATGATEFRRLVRQVATLMTYEVTRTLETHAVRVSTPMEEANGHRLAGMVTVVPVLRAGLGMAEAVIDLLPDARAGHLGMARDETTLEPVTYLERLPKDLGAGPVIVVDPMLATGGSASAAVGVLKRAGATDLRMMCLVAAPEGVERLSRDHPDTRVYAAVLDRQLNEQGFILPGLGDAGDRLFGT